MQVSWYKIEDLFDSLYENRSTNIVLAEFGPDGIEAIDFYGSAKKILDGKAMHIDSECDNPTHWMRLDKLEAFLEKVEKK